MAKRRKPKVKDQDMGMRAILRRVKALDGLSLEAGIVKTEHEDLAPRAAALEFGTKEAPEYAFFRKAFDQNFEAIEADAVDVVRDVAALKTTAKRRVRKMGPKIRKMLRRKVITTKSPANKPSTVYTKKSNNPGIDTRAYLNGISWIVTKKHVEGGE